MSDPPAATRPSEPPDGVQGSSTTGGAPPRDSLGGNGAPADTRASERERSGGVPSKPPNKTSTSAPKPNQSRQPSHRSNGAPSAPISQSPVQETPTRLSAKRTASARSPEESDGAARAKKPAPDATSEANGQDTSSPARPSRQEQGMRTSSSYAQATAGRGTSSAPARSLLGSQEPYVGTQFAPRPTSRTPAGERARRAEAREEFIRNNPGSTPDELDIRFSKEWDRQHGVASRKGAPTVRPSTQESPLTRPSPPRTGKKLKQGQSAPSTSQKSSSQPSTAPANTNVQEQDAVTNAQSQPATN